MVPGAQQSEVVWVDVALVAAVAVVAGGAAVMVTIIAEMGPLGRRRPHRAVACRALGDAADLESLRGRVVNDDCVPVAPVWGGG